ncbi:MAG: hypothetical protein EHM19_05080 [Candidatus Latescibacterota bacterium]|nr:MAG: hypothetical protein EHM19_05080 [Candidatus Latescibacterota bacterium]
MRCDEAKEALIEVLFGEPDDAAEGLLNEHLQRCAACRAEEKALIELRESFGRRTDDAAPAELRERIRRKLPARRRRSVLSLLARPIPAYAAAAACLLVALFARSVPLGGPEEPAALRPVRVPVDSRAPEFVVAGSYETSVGRHAGDEGELEIPPIAPGGDSL